MKKRFGGLLVLSEEVEEKKNKKMMKKKLKVIMKKSRSRGKVELKGRRWSDLELDLLGEIKKKLYLGDHIRFGAVCKSWNAAAAAPPRPGDVLPWLMLIRRRRLNSLVYKLYEPCSVPLGEPTFYDKIRLDPFIHNPKFTLSLCSNNTFGYGWLLISLFNLDATISHLILFSPLTKKTIMLPPLIHHLAEPEKTNFDFIRTFSCNPESPHCVYLILHIIHARRRIISLLHHGDKAWTSWESAGGYFPCPSVKHGVHIRGIFYFLYASGHIGSYNISSGKLTTRTAAAGGRGRGDNNSVLIFDNIHEFFEFKGDLMLTYYDKTNSFNYTIRRYDWSHKVWVPLQTLGDCSLFISRQTFYVEARDNGVSANKIYVLDDDTSAVYSLDNGRLFKCTSELKYWDDIYTGTFSPIWIQPQPQPQPPHHLQMRSGEFDAEEEVAQ